MASLEAEVSRLDAKCTASSRELEALQWHQANSFMDGLSNLNKMRRLWRKQVCSLDIPFYAADMCASLRIVEVDAEAIQ